MIRRERFINKLRELGFSYNSQGDRAVLYKKPGRPGYATVLRRDYLGEDFVRAQLRLVGCPPDDIERFIRQNGERTH